VSCRKEGLKVFYSLSGDDVIGLPDALRGVAERHVADVEKLVNTYLLEDGFPEWRTAGLPVETGSS